ncbi:hypothetical protein HHI36_022412 [Cryptolaemus montrouzieri]|uniref:Uncharacterized protein n=1 Tax=Cryptolaemus montrouzieri TaxID=559131 RepID=A0ABD2N0I1_9CUCU
MAENITKILTDVDNDNLIQDITFDDPQDQFEEIDPQGKQREQNMKKVTIRLLEKHADFLDKQRRSGSAKFWDIEERQVEQHFNNEEKASEDHFVRNMRRDQSGQYPVALPFNENIHNHIDSITLRTDQEIIQRPIWHFTDNLDLDLTKFWDIEERQVERHFNNEEKAREDHFVRNIKRINLDDVQ